MRQHEADFRERGVEVLIVGPEDADAFCDYWAQNDLPFHGLPDPDHRVLRLYGQEVNLFKLGRMPAQAVIDAEGVVRFVHYGKSMSDIPPVTEVLALIDALGQPVAERT